MLGYNLMFDRIHVLDNTPRGMEIVWYELDDAIPIMERAEEWCSLMNRWFGVYGIVTPKQAAWFIAQCAHESMYFNRLSENLNYSAAALLRVFPRHFRNMEEAMEYERNPERIANRVYANRMGNGDERSGDGWKYRGRGVIQLTGRYNYSRFSKHIGYPPILEVPDLVSSKMDLALRAALWFWRENNLNRFVDRDDYVGLTKAINGGYNGLEHRQAVKENIIRDMEEIFSYR